MQLDQILSAAVAAVNVEEMQDLPSPSLPQHSPTAPASAHNERFQPVMSEPQTVVGDGQYRQMEDIHDKTTMQADGETTAEVMPDISFFALDEDNLVITSQQALEMFETPPEAEDYNTAYHVLTGSEGRPEVNTPPMMSEEEAPYGRGEVPVLSAEVEVHTTLDTPQYTPLAPATASPAMPVPSGSLDSFPGGALQEVPGTTLDATMDANGHFVVQVVAPGINMTIPNNFVGSEEAVYQPARTSGDVAAPLPHPSYPQHQGPPHSQPHHLHLQNNSEIEIKAIYDRPYSGEEPSTSRSDVLTALRESIFRSRAKRRARDDGRGREGDVTPAKRRLLSLLDDPAGQDLPERRLHQEGEASVAAPPLDQPANLAPAVSASTAGDALLIYPEDLPVPPHDPSSTPLVTERLWEQPTVVQTHSSDPSSSPLVVMRPEELPAALQHSSDPSSSPLIVMRPGDLPGGGVAGDEAEPLHVQLVYLVYPLEGNQSRRMPSEISYGYPTSHDVPKSSLRMPSASSKKYEWSCSKREVEYPNKPVAKWTQEDVVDFIYAASSKLNCEDDEINGAVLSGMKGSCLLQLDENGFNQLCKKDGDKIYRYFQEYKAKEERRHLHIESHPQYFTNSHLYSLALELNGDKCTHQPHLDPRETAAPYEVRYETIDYRGLSFDDKSRNLLSSDKLPSAALKSFAPLTTMSPPDLSNGTAENMSDPEQSTSEEEPRPEPPKKRGPGRPRKPENELKKKKKKTGRLWEFIRNLLLDPATCPSLVRWENADEGMFRFVQAEKVAQKWGDRKQNKEMNYEKLSRAMRYYYKTHIFEAVLGRRLVYKFGKNAKDWRPSNPNFPDLQTH